MLECLERDQDACILLGTSDPDVRHIIPFAVNSNEKNRYKTTQAKSARILWLGSGKETTGRFKLISDYLGCSDMAWNMVSMNSQIHKWWAKSYFALKCLGIIPQSENESIIQLQLRWMPRSQKQKINVGKGKNKAKEDSNLWQRAISLDEGKKLVEDWKESLLQGEREDLMQPGVRERGGIVSAVDAISNRLLHSGHVLQIQMSTDEDMTATEKAQNMKAMVDLQWACIQIASMSGAAGSPDFLVEPPSDDEDDWLTTCYEQRQRPYRATESHEISPGKHPVVAPPDVPAANMPLRTHMDTESRETPLEKGPETSE